MVRPLVLRWSAKSDMVTRCSSGFPPWSSFFLSTLGTWPGLSSLPSLRARSTAQTDPRPLHIPGSPYARVSSLKPGPWTVISSSSQMFVLPILRSAYVAHPVLPGTHGQPWWSVSRKERADSYCRQGRGHLGARLTMEVKGLERKDSQLLRVEAVPSLHRAGLLMNVGPIVGRCAWEKKPA